MVQLIYTIGHSTRNLDDFLALLKENGIRRLADIRRFPGSRRYPHFSRQAMEKSLPENGIEYVHFEDLGGRRAPLDDSPNTALRNGQFRGYADHMATPLFRTAVDRLLDTDLRTAVMCAEAVPWKCHRHLLADELARRGVRVVHILGHGQRQEHTMNATAEVVGDHVVYVNRPSALGLRPSGGGGPFSEGLRRNAEGRRLTVNDPMLPQNL